MLILSTQNVDDNCLSTLGNGKVEWKNGTNVVRLLYYVVEHQRDWDLYTQLLTYPYNTRNHRVTILSLFAVILLLGFPCTSLLNGLARITTDVPGDRLRHSQKRKLLHRVAEMKSTVSHLQAAAQQQHKQCFDRNVRLQLKLIVDSKVLDPTTSCRTCKPRSQNHRNIYVQKTDVTPNRTVKRAERAIKYRCTRSRRDPEPRTSRPCIRSNSTQA